MCFKIQMLDFIFSNHEIPVPSKAYIVARSQLIKAAMFCTCRDVPFKQCLHHPQVSANIAIDRFPQL